MRLALRVRESLQVDPSKLHETIPKLLWVGGHVLLHMEWKGPDELSDFRITDFDLDVHWCHIRCDQREVVDLRSIQLLLLSVN